MKDRKKIIKIILYFFLAVLSFAIGMQMNKYLIKEKNKNTIDMAYCLTLSDYLIKAKNNIETIDKKTTLYIIGGILQSKKNILKKTCPNIYYNALNFYNKNKNNIFK